MRIHSYTFDSIVVSLSEKKNANPYHVSETRSHFFSEIYLESMSQCSLSHIEYANVSFLTGWNYQLMLGRKCQARGSLIMASKSCMRNWYHKSGLVEMTCDIRCWNLHAIIDFFCGRRVSHMATFLLSELWPAVKWENQKQQCENLNDMSEN